MNNISEERKRELEEELIAISKRLRSITNELGISVHMDSSISFTDDGSTLNYTHFHFHDFSSGKHKYLVCVPVIKVNGVLSREFNTSEEDEDEV